MSSTRASEPVAADHTSPETAARVAELFERHGRMVLGVCRTILRDVHEAEDATQQTFLSAHSALLRGASVRDSGAWIATIARNECRKRISAGMRNPLPVSPEDLVDLQSEADDLEERLRANELVEALAGLPERQREAVLLRYIYGLRYYEVSKALGLSLPATEALLFRARRQMRIRLRPAAAAVLVVPMSLRDGLASALPGFDFEAGAGAGAGLSGGLIAKLSAPTLAKIAMATVAASTVGAVGVQFDRPAQHVHRLAVGVEDTPRISRGRAERANQSGADLSRPSVTRGAQVPAPQPRFARDRVGVMRRNVGEVGPAFLATVGASDTPSVEEPMEAVDQAPVENQHDRATVSVHGEAEASPATDDSPTTPVAASDGSEQPSPRWPPDSPSVEPESASSVVDLPSSDSSGPEQDSGNLEGSGVSDAGAISEDGGS